MAKKDRRNKLQKRRKEDATRTDPGPSERVSVPIRQHQQSSGFLWIGVVGPVLAGLALFLVRAPGDGSASQTSTRQLVDIPKASRSHNPNSFEVLQVYDHDPGAFTQGLTYAGGKLYEGTGNHGQSELRIVDIASGETMSSHKMDDRYFGEGIAHYLDKNGEERIIQLTYKTRKGFIYSAEKLELLQEFHYETTTNEGWGITYRPERQEFIVSDGSDYLFVWDRDTLQEKRRIQVRIPLSLLSTKVQQQYVDTTLLPVKYLNELEWDQGTVLANVWYQDIILRINVDSGLVQRNYDFSSLYPRHARLKSADCFNGIAVSNDENELFVTGKWWPHLYRIRLLN